jgi:hypothetical protein
MCNRKCPFRVAKSRSQRSARKDGKDLGTSEYNVRVSGLFHKSIVNEEIFGLKLGRAMIEGSSKSTHNILCAVSKYCQHLNHFMGIFRSSECFPKSLKILWKLLIFSEPTQNIVKALNILKQHSKYCGYLNILILLSFSEAPRNIVNSFNCDLRRHRISPTAARKPTH